MVKNIILIMLSLIFFIGCSVSDIVKTLHNNYVYTSESSKQRWIMKNPLSINSKDYIPCKIEKYSFDNNFILAKIKFHYDMNCVVGFDESKVLKEGNIYYYILNIKDDIRYGPFETKEAFNKQKQKLGIKLKL